MQRNTRHSLRPSSWRDTVDAKLGRIAPREREVVAAAFSWPILRDAANAAPQDEGVMRGAKLNPHGEEAGAPEQAERQRGRPRTALIESRRLEHEAPDAAPRV